MKMRSALFGAVLALAPAAAQADEAARDAFMRANLMNIISHELGHYAIDAFDVPLLGREENAANGFANLLMIESSDPDAMLEVIAGWAAAAQDSDFAPQEDLSSEHALAGQRLAAAACDLIGSAPEQYAGLANDFGLKEDQRLLCADDLARRRESWLRVLPPPMSVQAGLARISVAYMPDPGFTRVMDDARQWRVAENAAHAFAELTTPPGLLSIRFESCGEPNAFYEPGARMGDGAIIVCYEYIEELRAQFAQLYED